MPLVSWRRVKPLEDPTTIAQFEKEYRCKLSDELKRCIIANNGGRPTPNGICLPNGEENDVKMLLSFNRNDIETIYKVIDYFVEHYHCDVIPFASDSSGNYYCERSETIVLWTQSDEIVPVCDKFTSFLEALYDI